MSVTMELLGLPPRGRSSKLEAEKVRDLLEVDLESLLDAKPLEQVSPIQQLRHQHHLLARLIAEGKQLTEAALITGYSIAYISRLKTQDRAFRDLIDYYKSQVSEVYVNVHERLAGLSLNTTEELQERLALHPETFTNRELMELSELCLDRTGYGPQTTQKSVVTLLSSDDIDRLKLEVSRRQNGTVKQISSRDSQSLLSQPVVEVPVGKGEVD